MVDPQLIRRRLVSQGLVTRPFSTPHAVAAAQVAMQGQDLPGVMASIALRLAPDPGRPVPADGVDPGIARVIDAFDDGSIVRGYPMRGTVFVTAAEDLRWITELCAVGPLRSQVARRGQLGLDEEQVRRARAILETALEDRPRGISRLDLYELWEQAGLSPAGGRGYHLLSHHIETGIAAYGPWNGRDNDIVLAETWLPEDSSIAERFGGDEDAAVAELLERYLIGHGPATEREFAWWTKLRLGRIRRAIATIADRLEREEAPDGQIRWSRPGLDDEVARAGRAVDATFLLPGFDELVLGYPDRLALLAADHHPALVPGNNGVFQRGMLRRGRIVGTWRRGGRPGRRALELSGFTPLPRIAEREAESAYRRFPHVGE